jgi:hypothetical protein
MSSDSKIKQAGRLLLLMVFLLLNGLTAVPPDAELSLLLGVIPAQTGIHLWILKSGLLGCIAPGI